MCSSSMKDQRYVGIVKQVLSGDCVAIRSETGTPPAVKQIMLMHIAAPKIACRPCDNRAATADEPWAWEAREFLRNKILGKRVTFTETTHMARKYGWIWLHDEIRGENVITSVVAAGYASVCLDGRASAELLDLLQLEKLAKKAKRGMWSPVAPGLKERRVDWSPNPQKLMKQYAGRPVAAIIEHVRDGTTIRAFLLPDKPNVPYALYNYISMELTGISSPHYMLSSDGRQDRRTAVPFAEEARFYTECRLLQEDVHLVIDTVVNGSIVGRVLHWRGDIAVSLLREGLAKCIECSSLPQDDHDNYRRAEHEAQTLRKRIWQGYSVANRQTAHNDSEFSGIVIEVLNGDGLNVLMANGIEKKVLFAAIRPLKGMETKSKNRSAGGQRSRQRHILCRRLFDVPWMFEAREFLRNNLLRKKVHCVLEFSVTMADGKLKCFYEVYYNGQNVAELLISKGLARCASHIENNGTRTTAQEKLMAVWQKAITEQVGMHAKEKRGPMRVVDLTTDHSHLRQHYLPVWLREQETEAIVEFVASGSRVRIFIPKQNCLVMFALAGVVCPRASSYSMTTASNAIATEPYGDDAIDFTRYKVLQRNVKVKVESIDKCGTSLIGSLWTNTNENLSVALLEAGLAKLHDSANKLPLYRQMLNAQRCAEAAKKNVWSESAANVGETPSNGDTQISKAETKFHNVLISMVNDASKMTFYAQYLENAVKFNKMSQRLQAFYKANPRSAGKFTLNKGDWCAAVFSYDRLWYRAKIVRFHNRGLATVLYIDYGNSEIVAYADIAELPREFIAEPAYAVEYKLALLHLPIDDEENKEVRRWFAAHVKKRTMQLNVEVAPLGAVPAVRLLDPQTKEDVALKLITDGLAFVDKQHKHRLIDLYQVYIRAQQRAHQSHIGIWRYGDARRDDPTA